MLYHSNRKEKRAKKEIQISDVKKFWAEKKSRSIDRSQDRGQKKNSISCTKIL